MQKFSTALIMSIAFARTEPKWTGFNISPKKQYGDQQPYWATSQYGIADSDFSSTTTIDEQGDYTFVWRTEVYANYGIIEAIKENREPNNK
jgi:hypothetical protein